MNLTQDELSQRSGVSIRTIQRIESGTQPKGYTLKMLAKALDTDEADLLAGAGTDEAVNRNVLKVINLSALPFTLLPPLNVLVPLAVMLIKKEHGPVAKKIISIQFIWTLVAAVLLAVVLILNDWFSVPSPFTLTIPIVWVLANSVVILRNAVEISRSDTPQLFPDFSVF